MVEAAERAVVVGAGLAGLLAARALADTVAEVVVVDRDPLLAEPVPRRGVPQGRHIHTLLARGRQVLEQVFPGFTEEVVARGGLTGDMARDGRVYVRGRPLVSYDSGLQMVFASRPLLESVVRDRVRALPGVRLLGGTTALGLQAADGAVTGLRVTSGAESRVLPAALVVSAAGRAASSTAWLRELGYGVPEQEVVRPRLTYVTRAFRRRPQDLDGARFLVVAPEPPDLRGGAAFAVEGGRWLVSLIGYLGDRAPTDLPGFRERAAQLSTPALARLLADAEPAGGPEVHHFAESRRLRYDRLRHFPEGYLVVGDGLCSFTPTYGQGMTVAAEESLLLQEALRQGRDGLAPRFFAASSRVVDRAWAMSAAGDLRYPGVAGRRTPVLRVQNAYLVRLLVAAQRDPVVADAFFRATNLLSGPESLLRPGVLARVLRSGVGRSAPRPAPERAAARA